MRTVPRRSCDLGVRHFGHQVGGHDGARDIVELVFARVRRPSAGSALRISSESSSTPITPVEAGSTCATGSSSRFASSAAACRARPRSPVRVAQLALPALTRIAPACRATCAGGGGESRTGAACTRFCVNTAAAEAGTPGHDQCRDRLSCCSTAADARVRRGVSVSEWQLQLELSQDFILLQSSGRWRNPRR